MPADPRHPLHRGDPSLWGADQRGLYDAEMAAVDRACALGLCDGSGIIPPLKWCDCPSGRELARYEQAGRDWHRQFSPRPDMDQHEEPEPEDDRVLARMLAAAFGAGAVLAGLLGYAVLWWRAGGW